MLLLRLMLLVAIATLVACGGGSGNGSSNSASSVAPDLLTLSSTQAVSFDEVQGWGAPQSQVIDVRATEGHITISQSGPMFTTSFTATDASSGRLTIRGAAPTDVGTYSGTITVSACSNASGPCEHVRGSPKTITVVYNVYGLSVTPRQLTFSSTGTNPKMQTAILLGTSGLLPYTWDVSYSPALSDWLQINPRGDKFDLFSPTQVMAFNVNAASLPPGVHSAVVTFKTTPSNSTPSFSAQVTVTLFVGDPTVNFVAPYVVPAGSSDNVIIRGRGFSALSPDSLSVQFSSTPALRAAVVSDTEIRATYPPLVAGSYSISVGSAGTSIPSRGALKLVVIDPPNFPLHTIPRPATASWPTSLIYDAERQALLFADPANHRILRYDLSDNGSTSLEAAPIREMALTPDGTELIGPVPGGRQILHLNPVTLAVLSSTDIVPWLRSDGSYTLAFANDGGAITNARASNGISTLYRYDVLTHAFTPIDSRWHLAYRPISASPDGRTLVLPYASGNNSIGDSRIYTYDASTGALSAQSGTSWYAGRVTVGRNASRTIVSDVGLGQRTIYDAAFNVLGAQPEVLFPFVLSPNANFAYFYYWPDGRVRKFDVSAPSGVTEVGSGSVVAPANTEMSEMAISPDGGTLFLVGRTSVVIAPAP